MRGGGGTGAAAEELGCLPGLVAVERRDFLLACDRLCGLLQVAAS